MFKNFSNYALDMVAPLYEQIEMALTHNFRGIDLDVVDMAEQFELRGEQKARRLIDSARIHLGSFELPVRLEGTQEEFQQDLEQLPARAEVAARLNCHRARVILNPASDSLPFHENFELHRTRLQQAAQVLQQHQIRLAIGFQAPKVLREGKAHEFIHRLDQLLPLVDMIPDAGLLVDPWEVAVSGGALENITSLPPEKVVVVHISDGPADKPPQEWTPDDRLIPGTTGVLDLVGLLEFLKQINYEGPVTPLVSKAQRKDKRRDDVVRQLGESLEELFQKVGLGSTLVPTPPTG